MHVIKTEEYDWAQSLYCFARYKNSGKIVPLSEYSNGYLYAYAPSDAELEETFGEPLAFNDMSEYKYWTSNVDSLSARGVIVPDENGAFNAEQILTRGQMAQMLAAVLDSSMPEADPGFSDLTKDSPFYGPVSTLVSEGVLDKGGAFEPSREMTREEFVSIMYRMLLALGGNGAGKPIDDSIGNIVDMDAVSENAKEAYNYLLSRGMHVLKEFDGNDEYFADDEYFAEDVPYFLHPQTPIIRSEAAELLLMYISDFMRANFPPIAREAATEIGLDKQMPRIDGSTSSYPITTALYWNLFENGNNHPSLPQQHSKTIASYENLIAKEADIIIVPDPSDDVRALAEESGVEMEFIPIANEALVFFTGKDNTTDTLSLDQIRNIYVDNAYSNWNEVGGPNAPLSAFCRNNDSGSHALMERFFLGDNEINENIRIERTSIIMASIITDVSSYQYDHPGTFALGYSMYYYYKLTGTIIGTEDLKLLAVDGISPTDESIADKSYPLVTNYYAVIRSDEPDNSPARNLAQWLTSDAGQLCVENAGFGPMRIVDGGRSAFLSEETN